MVKWGMRIYWICSLFVEMDSLNELVSGLNSCSIALPQVLGTDSSTIVER